MPLFEIFPAYLLDKDREDDFLLALKELPIPDPDKKRTLIQWCQLVGVALTKDMIDAVVTHPREV